MSDRRLTPAQVSERTGIAVQTLARWRCHREGPTYEKAGRKILYPETELEAWLKARRVATP